MKKLVEGIHQFQNGIFSSQRELFQRLASGQEPETLFITCSDSRISPGLITQTRPGDLFILRNAGNIVPAHGARENGEAATIEYAVAALGVKDIIVCGHSHCGAMKAVLDPTPLEKLPAMKSWLQHAEATRQVMDNCYADVVDPVTRLEVCVEENVLVQLENLRTHPTVLSALLKGTLRLHAWVYSIETGKVHSFDAGVGQFRPIAEAGTVDAVPGDRLVTRRSI